MSSIIIVLAKAPILGEVKTRIGKKIGMERSKWIYEQLLSHTSNVTKKTKIKTVLFKKKYKKIILIGADLWTLNEKIIIDSFKLLDKFNLVIGPSYDGGYFLIGMKKPNENIFKNIPWSTNNVLEKTISKMKTRKISFLEITKDIDSFSDLKSNLSLLKKYNKKFMF